MRNNMKLHTICILALSSILTIEAHAQLDPNMEAQVCATDCLFAGNSQASDNLGGLSKLPRDGGARFYNVNRYEDNHDQALDSLTNPQFRAVGQIETNRTVKNSRGQEGVGTATAFLISPCYVLSNNHAVFGDDFPSMPQSETQREQIGSQYVMNFNVGGQSSRATPVVWGDRDGANRNDWALLKLDNCLGKQTDIGWMDVDMSRNSTTLSGTDVAVASFPSDRADSLRISWGKATGYNSINNTVRYNVSTAPGSSGGAVVATKADGSMAVIGMHRGGKRDISDLEKYAFKTYSDAYANEFLNIRDIIQSSDVRARLVDDIKSYGQGNSNHGSFNRGIPVRKSSSST